MVGDRRKVEWTLDLRLHRGVAVFVGQEKRLAFGVAISIPRIVALAGNVGIKRVAAVDVEVTEERLSQGLADRADFPFLGALEGECVAADAPEQKDQEANSSSNRGASILHTDLASKVFLLCSVTWLGSIIFSERILLDKIK